MNKQTIAYSIKLYNKGIICSAECHFVIIDRLNEETIDDYKNDVPEDHKIKIRERVGRFPADDDEEGWRKMVFVSGNSYAIPTPEAMKKVEEEILESRLRFRKGVAFFRKNNL